MVPIGAGMMVTAGTFAAGTVLIVRDLLSDVAGRAWVLAAIVSASAVSAVGAPIRIAVASAVAFAVSELLDWGVYAPLRMRGWGRAVFASSAVAAPVDTALFLAIAGFPVTLGAVAGQVTVKTALAALVLGMGHVLLRYRQQRRSA
jgi:uncharacterized PurR-regulated membrane protein YhhQ (DUF165 family)